MNFKQFGALLSISTILGINVIGNRVLAQSITFGNAVSSGGCTIDKQLPGLNGRSLSIVLNNMRATNGQRARCIIRVNTMIPPGFFVQSVQVLHQGTITVPARGSVTFNRNYSFAGGSLGLSSSGPFSTVYQPTMNPDEPFEEIDNLFVLSGTCTGGQGNFGINMNARGSVGTDWILDTTDINAGRSANLILIFGINPC